MRPWLLASSRPQTFGNSPMAANQYDALFETAGRKWNVDPGLLRTLADQESDFDPKATGPQTSSGRAGGLMQIVPATAKKLGVDPYKPEEAVDGAARLLSEALDRHGNVPDAVSEYYGGADPKLWGPKTRKYRGEVMAKYQGAATPTDADSILFGDASAKKAPTTASPADDVLFGDKVPAPQPVALTSQKPSAVPQQPQTSEILGFQKGLARPLDNLALWTEGGLNKLGVNTDAVNKFLGMDSAKEAAASHEAFLQKRAAEGVKPGMAGQIVGNVLGTLPAAIATKNPFIGGGIGGALTTEHPMDAGSVAWDAGLGAAGGKLAEVGLNRLGGAISPKVLPAVQKLLGEGVEMTPGQILGGIAKTAEDKLTSVPILGDMIQGARARSLETFNRAAVSRVLKPIGAQLPEGVTGHEAVKFAGETVSKAYDDLLSKATAKSDKQFAMEMGKIAQEVRSTLPKDRAAQFEKTMRDLLTTKMAKNGTMTGEQIKAAEAKLGLLSRQYGKSPDGDQQLLGQAYRDAQGELRELVERNNPAVAQRLKAINTAFATLIRVERAAGSVGAEKGVFTPAQLHAAVKASDSSLRKKATARGQALMQEFAEDAKAVLPSKVPDSGTPGRIMMGLLTGGGLAGGAYTGAVNPVALLAGAAGLAPYTKVGGRLVSDLLTKRPAGAPAARHLVESLRTPAVLAGGAAAPKTKAKPRPAK